MEIEKVMTFNRDQIEHLQILQKQVLEVCNKIYEVLIQLGSTQKEKE